MNIQMMGTTIIRTDGPLQKKMSGRKILVREKIFQLKPVLNLYFTETLGLCRNLGFSKPVLNPYFTHAGPLSQFNRFHRHVLGLLAHPLFVKVLIVQGNLNASQLEAKLPQVDSQRK